MERIPEETKGSQEITVRDFRRKTSLESSHRRLSPQPPYFSESRSSFAGRQRKSSFPTTSLSSYQHNTSVDLSDASRRYRRFSNVSDAVTRKLSTTLGWRTVSTQEVVTQARSLCGQHIRAFLKRRGLFNKKLGLQRLQSVSSLSEGLAICDVFVQFSALCQTIEGKYPRLYEGVCRQMGVSVITEKAIAQKLSAMGNNMFSKDISWFKVASFFNVVAGVAVDCVKQGHPEYLYSLVETAGLVIERDVANWIANQGGWTAVLTKYRAPEETSVFQTISLSVVGLILILVTCVIVLRTIVNMLFYTN